MLATITRPSVFFALQHNTFDADNIALGYGADFNLTTGANNIDIGNRGSAADESDTIRIGDPEIQTATHVARIYGTPIFGGAHVVVNSSGQLGIAAIGSSTPSAPSSRRFRQEILRDEAMNAKLRSDFIKEHRTVQKLEALVAKQQRDFQAAAS